MTHSDRVPFDEAWSRFSSWLSVHSPAHHAALRPPATSEEIAAVEAHFGFPLHPHLRALLERHDGVAAYAEPGTAHAGAFLPLGHRLSTAAFIVRHHDILMDIRDNLSEGTTEDDLNGHVHQWVPFAHPNDGGVAFVDHRPGPTYGRVHEMGIGSGDIDGVEWAADLAELFDSLATSVETGEPFGHYRPGTLEHPPGQFSLCWEIRC